MDEINMTAVYQYRYRYQTGEWCGWREASSCSARDSLVSDFRGKGIEIETRDLFDAAQISTLLARTEAGAEGMVLVPVELTPSMREAMMSSPIFADDMWAAAIAAQRKEGATHG